MRGGGDDQYTGERYIAGAYHFDGSGQKKVNISQEEHLHPETGRNTVAARSGSRRSGRDGKCMKGRWCVNTPEGASLYQELMWYEQQGCRLYLRGKVTDPEEVVVATLKGGCYMRDFYGDETGRIRKINFIKVRE